MSRFSKGWKLGRVRFPRFGNVAWMVLMLVVGSAEGSVESARATAEADLAVAQADLAAVRETISQERSGLSLEVEGLQAEVRALRDRWRDVQRVSVQAEAERAASRRRAEAVQAEVRNLAAMITEFRRAAEAGMSAAQVQRYRAVLEELDAKLEADGVAEVSLDAGGVALELAFALMGEDLPSRPFAGSVLDHGGRVREGRMIPVGPLVYFVGDDDLVGIVSMDDRGREPVLMTGLDRRIGDALAAWARGETDMVPVDVTDGALVKVAKARVSWWERMKQGGVVMIPLLLIGLASVVMVVSRYIALSKMDVDVNPAVTEMLAAIDGGRVEEARRVAAGLITPWREVLVDAVDHCRADRVYLEEVLQDRIVMQGPKVSQYLGALAICAAAAPLLGLLGTVTGMIHTFQLITVFGTGDARSLSGGISEALITTQVGLTIAVPVLLAHAYLARRAKGIVSGLEQVAIRFVRNVAPEVRDHG